MQSLSGGCWMGLLGRFSRLSPGPGQLVWVKGCAVQPQDRIAGPQSWALAALICKY